MIRLQKSIEEGKEFVASSFIILYPPGFPVLVPGQVISEGILRFMLALDVSEIHGYRADLGLPGIPRICPEPSTKLQPLMGSNGYFQKKGN